MAQTKSLRNYLVITAGYWAFTITDGAIRMLVVLYFHQLGYTPLAIASLFLFYEFFGIVTNLVGGWLGARIGLNATMHIGMGLQVFALGMLAVDPSWLSIPYVMAAQALSGIAKDLNKMSAKASVKLMLPGDAEGTLFKWVTVLTGSKNTLKGAGFFVGAYLLSIAGFRGALIIMAGALFAVLIITWMLLPGEIGKTAAKAKFSTILSKSPAVNWLSAARFFLFGARDVWFVVALPVFLSSLGWSFTEVGSFIALWIIGYGIVQASAPKLLRHGRRDGRAARQLAFILSAVPAAIAIGMQYYDVQLVVICGLILFGILFAINSALHSYLIVLWSEREHVSMNVGFYYMANAGGRLTGTLLSGWVYQTAGLTGCLWWSCAFLLATWLISFRLPTQQQA
ncbi:MAG: organoarsenical effux MFS transporter ArsJ [Pseudomonadota bacterium]